MKKFLPFLLCFFLVTACKNDDKAGKTDKEKKEKNVGDDTLPPDWTTSRKKKAATRYLELISAENKSIYDSNSEEALNDFTDCIISKISGKMHYEEFTTVMDNVEAGKKLKGLDPDLKEKAEGVEPYFDKCRKEFNIKTRKEE